LNTSELTESDAVTSAASVAVNSVNGVGVPVLKSVIVAQPLQGVKLLKLPDTAPTFAGFVKSIDVAVYESVPFKDIEDPAAIGAA
jgi:hypothetical protein